MTRNEEYEARRQLRLAQIRRWIYASVTGAVLVIALGMWGCPQYNVWQQEGVHLHLTARNEAALARANQDRQIRIAEAKALQESAQFRAQAEITRAEGVARANEIIGESLRNNEAYLRYLFIDQLGETNADVIYIPTEAGLPILEAGRLRPPPVAVE